MKQNNVKMEHVKEYVGHKGRTDIDFDLYGKQFRPDVLMEHVVMKIDYGLDLSHLKDSNASGKESLSKIKESCQQIKEIVFKLSNLQDVVLTDYIAEHKMIDIDRSFTTAERARNAGDENHLSQN